MKYSLCSFFHPGRGLENNWSREESGGTQGCLVGVRRHPSACRIDTLDEDENNKVMKTVFVRSTYLYAASRIHTRVSDDKKKDNLYI